ncbi:hypothetical protein F5X98DRAFT_342226 [Xylaria grammica]|nr:hypothetical protein F5X98DRAFT_342226 [Xylaria grammica]
MLHRYRFFTGRFLFFFFSSELSAPTTTPTTAPTETESNNCHLVMTSEPIRAVHTVYASGYTLFTPYAGSTRPVGT